MRSFLLSGRRMGLNAAALCVCLVVLALAGAAFARTEGTPHDFRSPANGGKNEHFPNLARIAGSSPCKVCHVTFSAGGRNKYMWGDDYGWQPTKEITLPESVFCSGCHDGQIVTKTGADIIPDAAMMVKNHKHPMESVYPVGGKKGFRAGFREKSGRWVIPTKWNVALPLYAGEDDEEAPRITCLTCHNPHEFGKEGLFLRVPSKVELCASCHAP
ncbi:MAG: cytochrome c3 family protein [Bacillota bacterium]|nr:cytochrome c3 family protein [Bacillota bacterium]